ncbi:MULTISPECIES: tetratricopeptide repeat protein [Sphingomonas]|uniref:tetratricopeptide repeat protein n=1 Tax=Sphingomonas TaxID=13687 RepID=UPI000DEFF1F4|nr:MULTISPECIES: tetratricopeptide repeat protein [Sphingomonas]
MGLAAVAAAMVASAPAQATRLVDYRPSAVSTFATARAAELRGDSRRAASLYAALAAADPTNKVVADRAIAQATTGGDMPLALRLIGRRPPVTLSVEARLLLAANALKSRKPDQAVQLLALDAPAGSLKFLAQPMLAWTLIERRDPRATAAVDAIPAEGVAAPLKPELGAFALLAQRNTAGADPLARRAIDSAGGRAVALRLAFADAFLRAGDQPRALALLDGSEPAVRRARALVAAGRRPDGAVETAAQGYGLILDALALDLNRESGQSLPAVLAQVARFADPGSDYTRLLAGALLGQADRTPDALAALRSIDNNSAYASQAHDAEVSLLNKAERRPEALARAQAFAQARDADYADWGRLGDTLDGMDRQADAAAAYGKAIALLPPDLPNAWQFYLLQGAMLERAGRWEEAKASLTKARALAPQSPTVLNYLGYAQLERGENLDAAEALIAEAHRLAPDDASITDSLGWAQYKRGKVSEAIKTLTEAAAKDPTEGDIHEHLGDALYTAGRRFEARNSWNAALVVADDKSRPRLVSKLQTGLGAGNAAR